MEKETLDYLIEYVGSISPELWNATVNYIYAAACQWLVGGIALFILGILCGFVDYKLFDSEEINGVGYFIGAISIGISFICFANAIGRFIAPEMYAIKYLLNFRIL